MPAPTTEDSFSPTLLPIEGFSAWLREARLLTDNPFVADGTRLYIGARDKKRGAWYQARATARKHDLLTWAEALEREVEKATTPTHFKKRVLPSLRRLETALPGWIGWQTLQELEAAGWLPYPLCALRTDQAVNALVQRHYEEGLPPRLDAQDRLSRILRTSGVADRFGWRALRAQWDRLPWPAFIVDAGPIPPPSQEEDASNEEGWQAEYLRKTRRRAPGAAPSAEDRTSPEEPPGPPASPSPPEAAPASDSPEPGPARSTLPIPAPKRLETAVWTSPGMVDVSSL